MFSLLGIQPLAGRSFVDGDDRPGNPRVAMISEGLWKRRFGGDRSVVGSTVTLNGNDTTIVGIAPPSLALLSAGDVWVPLVIDPGREMRLNHVILAVGRIRQGVTLEQAQSEMDTVGAHVAGQYPEMKEWRIRLVTLF